MRSSSWTRSAGMVPAAMPQKMQSLMGSTGYSVAGRGTGSAESVRIAIASGTITHAATAQATNARDGSVL